MIDLYTWPTADGVKPLIVLEEAGLEHRLIPININEGEHLTEEFGRISPNRNVPVIVDHAFGDGSPARVISEPGAILQYLGEKSGKLIPQEPVKRAETLQWLFWLECKLGPTLAQFLHFSTLTDVDVPYAQGRFSKAKERIYHSLDDRLRDRQFVAGIFSIADISAYPWIDFLERGAGHLNGFANLQRWYRSISERSAVSRARDHAFCVGMSGNFIIQPAGLAADM